MFFTTPLSHPVSCCRFSGPLSSQFLEKCSASCTMRSTARAASAPCLMTQKTVTSPIRLQLLPIVDKIFKSLGSCARNTAEQRAFCFAQEEQSSDGQHNTHFHCQEISEMIFCILNPNPLRLFNWQRIIYSANGRYYPSPNTSSCLFFSKLVVSQLTMHKNCEQSVYSQRSFLGTIPSINNSDH